MVARLEELEKENNFLRSLLVPKNSQNSSVPPSTEISKPKRTSSLRKPTGRKPGGQPGHEGNGLKIVAVPDVIEKHIPNCCTCCGLALTDIPVLTGKRQLIDIPKITFVTTEQQTYKRRCTCGHTSQGIFSGNANAPVGYGENLETLVAYLHARHYLPVGRMKEMLTDVFGLSLSSGGICHLINRFAEKATPAYDLIKERLPYSGHVGSDETGCRVDGKLRWFWTWQSKELTYITYSPNRGQKTIQDNFPNGFPNSTLVHDAWKPHLNTPAKAHQLCTAHLARELNYLVELYKDERWTKEFLSLIQEALKLKPVIGIENTSSERDRIMEKFTALLAKPPDKANKKSYAFFKRMVKNREHIFPFLFDPTVPSDNNASERAIRNIKVKQKVSGQFKAEKAAMNFAKIRSVIDTTLKNSQNVLEALKLIALNNYSFG